MKTKFLNIVDLIICGAIVGLLASIAIDRHYAELPSINDPQQIELARRQWMAQAPGRTPAQVVIDPK